MARARRSNLGFGVMLVVVGGVLLLTRFALMATAPAWLLGLGAGLALIAIVGSSYGALVAAMVLLGLGSGMLLGDRGVGGLSSGGWILLGLGAGFIGIWLPRAPAQAQQPLVASRAGLRPVGRWGCRFYRHFALIPPEVMIAARTWWPALLVVAGAWILIRALRS